jgi:hypothetical protein
VRNPGRRVLLCLADQARADFLSDREIELDVIKAKLALLAT